MDYIFPGRFPGRFSITQELLPNQNSINNPNLYEDNKTYSISNIEPIIEAKKSLSESFINDIELEETNEDILHSSNSGNGNAQNPNDSEYDIKEIDKNNINNACYLINWDPPGANDIVSEPIINNYLNKSIDLNQLEELINQNKHEKVITIPDNSTIISVNKANDFYFKKANLSHEKIGIKQINPNETPENRKLIKRMYSKFNSCCLLIMVIIFGILLANFIMLYVVYYKNNNIKSIMNKTIDVEDQKLCSTCKSDFPTKTEVANSNLSSTTSGPAATTSDSDDDECNTIPPQSVSNCEVCENALSCYIRSMYPQFKDTLCTYDEVECIHDSITGLTINENAITDLDLSNLNIKNLVISRNTISNLKINENMQNIYLIADQVNLNYPLCDKNSINLLSIKATTLDVLNIEECVINNFYIRTSSALYYLSYKSGNTLEIITDVDLGLKTLVYLKSGKLNNDGSDSVNSDSFNYEVIMSK